MDIKPLLKPYNVGPPYTIAKLVQISPITMVYGRYIYTYYTQMIHVWNIYLHVPHVHDPNVGKHTIHGSSGYSKYRYIYHKP